MCPISFVFVALMSSASGEGFETLCIVLPFPQMFEDLGLRTCIAETNWFQSKCFAP